MLTRLLLTRLSLVRSALLLASMALPLLVATASSPALSMSVEAVEVEAAPPAAEAVDSGIDVHEIRSRPMEVTVGDLTLKGMLYHSPEAIESYAEEGPAPAVLVVHEWVGLNDYAKQRAKMLANSGVLAVAVDMYGDGKNAANTAQAAAWSGALKSDPDELRKRINAWLDATRELPELKDKSRIAAIGYCFGGTTVLELARSGADLAGVVSFHGGLDTPRPATAEGAPDIQAAVLVLHGRDDPFVPAEQVDAFKQEMDQADVAMTFISYPDAVHSFTNPERGDDPSTGAAYHAKADAHSWQHMWVFFDEVFNLFEMETMTDWLEATQ